MDVSTDSSKVGSYLLCILDIVKKQSLLAFCNYFLAYSSVSRIYPNSQNTPGFLKRFCIIDGNTLHKKLDIYIKLEGEIMGEVIMFPRFANL